MNRFTFVLANLCGIGFIYHVDACCDKISIDYEIQPSGGSTSDILQYLMGNIVFARAVKYNNVEGFVMLDANWTANPTIVPGNLYIWVTTLERQFEETHNVRSTIPENFGVGSSLDVVFRTASVVHNWFTVNIENQITNTVYLHMDIRPSWGVVVFNSRQGSTWSGEERITNPVSQADSVHIASIKYTSLSWNVHMNGSLIYSYQHRFNYRDDDEVIFSGSDTSCQRIIFYGPF